MSLGTIIYLVGMLAVFVGQRLLAGYASVQWLVTAAGVLALVVAAVLRIIRLRRAQDDGLRFGHRVALMFLLVGCASLVFYAATTDTVIRGLTLDAQGEERWLGIWRSLWPLVWLLGTVPLLATDYALQTSPVAMPRGRIREMTAHGLVAAMGIALVFPLNYIAHEHNEHWDLAYFKTTKPGTATHAIVESLEHPVDVRVFMPPASEVAEEVRDYFTVLEGPNLRVEFIDQAAQPRLAKALSVTDNGIIAFTVGEVDLSDTPAAPDLEAKPKPKPVTRTFRVGTDIDKARRHLRKLDAEVQKRLIEVGVGERTVYFTTGHGELQTKGTPQVDISAAEFKRTLSDLGFRVKSLGLAQGLGETIPSDADVVMVLGPQYPFTEPEVESLRQYIAQGGSVLFALEPTSTRAPQAQDDPLLALVAELGVQVSDEVLATERSPVRLTGNKLDRLNITTNAITAHGSSTTVAENMRSVLLFFFATGYLEEAKQQSHRVTFTVRSPATTWAEQGETDLEYQPSAGEQQQAWPLVAAIEGGEGDAAFRVIVSADATVFADLTQLKHPSFGNDLLIRDVPNWLVGAEALSGTTESEEDVRIEHTQEGQAAWFYLTVVAVPLGFFVLGALRVRWRLRSGTTGAGDRDEGGE